MRDLNYELKQLCQRNHDGSYATRHARDAILTQIANQLHELGFKDMRATSLKPKHVTALVELWKSQSLTAGTIKNRMTELRWWAEKVNKRNVMARDNQHYGIARRQYDRAASAPLARTWRKADTVRRPGNLCACWICRQRDATVHGMTCRARRAAQPSRTLSGRRRQRITDTPAEPSLKS